MVRRFFTILTGQGLPKIQLRRHDEPSIITEKTVADFTCVVGQTGILKRDPDPPVETHQKATPATGDK
jgi:hypothetical protein